MKRLRLLLALMALCMAGTAYGQANAEQAFHAGANLFIQEEYQKALDMVNRGLQMDPDNEKLRSLEELLKQEQEKKEQQQQQQQEQEQQNQEGEQEEQQDQQQSEQQQEQEQQQQNDQQQEQQQQEQENPSEEQGEEQQSGEEQQEQEQQDPEEQEGEPEEMPMEEEGEPEPMSEEELRERLEDMGLTLEKAQMILDAMQANEVQYLQQMKRVSKRRPKPGAPDW